MEGQSVGWKGTSAMMSLVEERPQLSHRLREVGWTGRV